MVSATDTHYMCANVINRCSYNYGTPPQIRARQFDVPLPKLEAVCAADGPQAQLSAHIYISLLGLTNVLGNVLEHSFNLTAGVSASANDATCDDLEAQLGTWRDRLDNNIRSIVIRGSNLEVAGAANLRLAYLTMELLLSRVDLDLRDRSSVDCISRPQPTIRAKRAAEDVVMFVEGLGGPQAQDVWIPQICATLTSATAFLLRIAVSSISKGDVVSGNGCLDLAIRMMRQLRYLRQTYGWDIADHCISQYGELVDKMDAMRHGSDQESDQQAYNMVSMPDIEAFMAEGAELPSMDLNAMFPSLWDMFEA